MNHDYTKHSFQLMEILHGLEIKEIDEYLRVATEKYLKMLQLEGKINKILEKKSLADFRRKRMIISAIIIGTYLLLVSTALVDTNIDSFTFESVVIVIITWVLFFATWGYYFFRAPHKQLITYMKKVNNFTVKLNNLGDLEKEGKSTSSDCK